MTIGQQAGWRRVWASRARPTNGLEPVRRRRSVVRHPLRSLVVLAGVPVLVLGLTAGTAAASGGGNVTIYYGISGPEGITAGPDGALWFTNTGNNSIGRITTAGVVTNYTGTGIDDPQAITAGPDGALWFTNFGNNSIGRITTTGVVTNYTGTGIDATRGDHGRARRGAVVHQLRQQLDRADHHHRGGDQLHRHRHRRPDGDHGRARTGRCGSPTSTTTRSGGSPPPGR